MGQSTRKKTVETFFQRGILRIGINRPEKKNALSLDMYEAMASAISEAQENDAVRVIMLHGTRDCFTSGNDLGDFVSSPPNWETSPVYRFLVALSQAEKPIIAMVNGPAIGIGTTMLLHCDLVYAGENALFQLPFVNLGLCPEAASSFLLPRLVGHLRAAELLMLGEPFGAEKAREMGLVNDVFPDGKLFQEGICQAQKLAERPCASVRLTKHLLRRIEAKIVSDTMSREGELFLERLVMPEAREAFSAFFAGRKPEFAALG